MATSVPEWIAILQALQWQMAEQVVLAALLGGVIGIERAWHGHAAGLRTNSLVAVGTCIFTILSIHGFPIHGAAQDTGRVAAQVVSGIGFLGAGVLLQSNSGVRGMTTAATIWLVSAIGMAVGARLYFLAIFTTLFSTGVLVLLHPFSTWLERRARERRHSGDHEV